MSTDLSDIFDFFPFAGINLVEPEISRKNASGIKAYNPYPKLGAPEIPVWPRGFPMDSVRDSATWSANLSDPPIGQSNGHVTFGVLQSLADIQPDVDAIYRLTHKTPFNFIRPPTIKPPALSSSE